MPPESCQPPPEPPSHSPRIARATTTFASSRSSGPVRLRVWPVARIRSAISDASRLVETASREPLGMSLTLLTTSSPQPGPDDPRQQVCEPDRGSLERGRHQARGDHARLHQPEIVVAEVEQLLQARRHPCTSSGRCWSAAGSARRSPAPGTRSAERAEGRGRGPPGPPRCSGPGHLRDSPCRGRRCPTSRCARGPAAPACARPGSGRARPPTRARGGGDGYGADVRRMPPTRNIQRLPAATPDRPPDLVGQGLEGDLLISLGQGAGDRSVGPVSSMSARGRPRSPARSAGPSGP